MAHQSFTRKGHKAYTAVLFGAALSIGLPFFSNPAAAVTAPSNNNFGAAEVLAGSGSIVRSNVGADDQIGEPSSIGGIALASVWFKWKAPASGMQQVDLIGSDPLVDPFPVLGIEVTVLSDEMALPIRKPGFLDTSVGRQTTHPLRGREVAKR